MQKLPAQVGAMMSLVGGLAFFIVVFATPVFRGWKDYPAMQWLAGVLLLVCIGEAVWTWRRKSAD